MNTYRNALLAAGLVAAVAAPAAAVAKPTKQDRQNAAKECKQLRGTTEESREAFAASYRNLGACVSEKAREQAAERRKAKRNAARECRELRDQDETAFAARYRNFGACVSSKAKQEVKAEDRKDDEQVTKVQNAAKECADERAAKGEDAFAQEYGTNGNKRNAFGKCVSAKSGHGEGAPTP